MHCDDKRTIFALKQHIIESEIELQESKNRLKIEMEKEKRMQIQTRIDDLERIIKDSKDQLLSME